MIKRPLDSRFASAVLEGRKLTTIRNKAWPVGVPIMLYHWAGAPYRSKHRNVAPVVVEKVQEIRITHREDGGMLYAYGTPQEPRLHETEGFESREAMDAWFRPLVKQGETIAKALMRFRLVGAGEVEPTTERSPIGYWTAVEDAMPDDDVSCLVWSDHLDDATIAFHDSEVRDRRGDSGWIIAGTSRVLLGVTHWCEDVFPPNDSSGDTGGAG